MNHLGGQLELSNQLQSVGPMLETGFTPQILPEYVGLRTGDSRDVSQSTASGAKSPPPEARGLSLFCA